MSAVVHVVDNPFFDVTGDEGQFNLSGLPAGTYTLTASHEVFGEKQQEVTVEPGGGPVEVNFAFTATE